MSIRTIIQCGATLLPSKGGVRGGVCSSLISQDDSQNILIAPWNNPWSTSTLTKLKKDTVRLGLSHDHNLLAESSLYMENSLTNIQTGRTTSIGPHQYPPCHGKTNRIFSEWTLSGHIFRQEFGDLGRGKIKIPSSKTIIF